MLSGSETDSTTGGVEPSAPSGADEIGGVASSCSRTHFSIFSVFEQSL